LLDKADLGFFFFLNVVFLLFSFLNVIYYDARMLPRSIVNNTPTLFTRRSPI